MGGGRRLGNGGSPLIARHRQVLRPPNRATAGNDRIFERQRKRVQYPCQPNKKTARRRSQSLSRERYWVALKIWSAWANKNQSQNPGTATKAPEKTRLERRFGPVRKVVRIRLWRSPGNMKVSFQAARS